ncbi:hypothetical protein [Nocardioides sp.]|uniref:hypothetical protein n=1 Tax=Nocardioides sp. TaxID=35761 RepID=UPI0031FF07EF|nr:hypothetical protein [Nocardioides sp.]
MSAEEPIEAYLDELFRSMTGQAGDVRRSLAEVEEHLRDSAAAHEGQGRTRLEAERAAIADFGAAATISRGFEQGSWRDLLRPVTLFAAVGLLAIGLSGVLAEVMGHVWSAGFVAGDLPGTTYTPQRCAYFQEYFPARDCLSSAAQHHWGEVVEYRVAAGLLGLVLLVVWRRLPRRRPLPRGVFATTGVGVFGAATLALAVETVNASALGWSGAGQWLSAAVVAGAVTAACALRMARELRLDHAWTRHPARPTAE